MIDGFVRALLYPLIGLMVEMEFALVYSSSGTISKGAFFTGIIKQANPSNPVKYLIFESVPKKIAAFIFLFFSGG